MWNKNVAGRFFGLVTKHACDGRTDRQMDGQTDRITTPKTALAKVIVKNKLLRFYGSLCYCVCWQIQLINIHIQATAT